MFAHLFKYSRLFSAKSRISQVISVAGINTESHSLKRSHFCGKLNEENIGEQVTICGWLQTVRFSNFLVLRDLHGQVQVNLDEEFFKTNASFSTESLSNESVLAINGIVERRPTVNNNLNSLNMSFK